MLHILPTQGDDKTGEPGVVATDALWLDLLNPTSARHCQLWGRLARSRRPAASETPVVSST
jgi:hypothetical protein